MEELEAHLKKPRVSESDNFDRISSLHDSVLHHIISFLPPKEVFRTMILSKRWKNLLKSLPDLNFEELERDKVESLTNFIDNFLHYHDKVAMTRFRLKLKDGACDAPHINAWVSAAVSSGVQKLICFQPPSILIFPLPSCLFTCNTLVALTLNAGRIYFPRYICFPKLRIMRLYHVGLSTSFKIQLLKSPNLTELRLKFCKIFGDRFSLDSFSWTNLEDVAKVEDAVKFEDKDDDSRAFSNLKKADVNSFVVTNNVINDAYSFVKQLSNVEKLDLRLHYIEDLYYEGDLFEHMPRFCNLKDLKIMLKTENGVFEVGVLACLLRLSPVLESLGITFDRRTGTNLRNRRAGEYPFLCLPPCLDWIQMNNFQGSNNQIELVRFFLENAQVLKKMIVRFQRPLYKEPDSFREELLSIPRLSAISELHIRKRKS